LLGRSPILYRADVFDGVLQQFGEAETANEIPGVIARSEACWRSSDIRERWPR
jgi:hypothetical protein